MAMLEKTFIDNNEIKSKYFVPRLLNELFTEIEEFSDISL
jgi:hypothetical protein